MKRTVTIALLFLLQASGIAHADLRPVSRNPLVFVTSTAEGQEWQAYRIVRPQSPAVFRVEGPGRVIFQVRSIVEGESDVPSVAVMMVGERAVLTARVEPELDADATLVDEPRSRRASKVAVFLVQVKAGTHRVTVRHSAGADLLVGARFAPPLVEVDTTDDGFEIPLVVPRRESPKTVQNIGAIEEDGDGLAVEPAPRRRRVAEAWNEPPPAADDDQRVRRGDPTVDGDDEDVTTIRTTADGPARPLTVRAPYFQFELRGGVLFSGFNVAPAPIVGIDARVAVPALDASRWSLGAAIDVTHTSADANIRGAGGATVGIAEVTQTAMLAGVDLRYVWLRRPDRFDAYASLGATGLFGSLVTKTNDRRTEAGLAGGLAALRLGGTLGDRGSRPFAELRVLAGVVASDIVQQEGGAPGRATGYSAVSLVVGYRVELLSEVSADVR